MASGREETWLARAGATLEAGPLVRARGYFTSRMRWMLLIVGVVLFLLFGWVKGVPWVFVTFFMDKDSFIQPQTISTVHPRWLSWQTQVTGIWPTPPS